MAGEGGGGEGPSGGEYDVFLNFRGEDTRRNFVSCLHVDMEAAGIKNFIDSEEFHVGEVIGDKLMRAIDNSKIFMPVFSRNYAYSKWCQLELQHNMTGRSGQEVMPVFYNVSPEDVKLRTKLYSDGLVELEKKHGTVAVKRWRECLKKVSKITGWNSKEFEGDGKLIERIIKDVLRKTRKRYMKVTEHLVGIEGGVEAMMELLDDRIDHVRFVIIHGMGGIGKTTLAKVIFNDVFSNFDGCSFLSDVRESLKGKDIVKLQQQILKDVLRRSVKLNDADDGVNEIEQRCSDKSVLLVLDDVDKTEQVEKLAGSFNWFGRGSRIIITTRDYNVIPIGLRQYNARRKNQIPITGRGDDHECICYYQMREMDVQYATALFRRHTFSDDGNSFNDGKLLQEIVATTGGLPEALVAVGSELFGETEDKVWRENLEKWKREPHNKVKTSLLISYESLEDDDKQNFLDIACFFWGIQSRILKYVWKASDIYPESGVKALLDKSLIKIVDGDRIWMHNQLRYLGREIVRRDKKSCRIRIHKDAFRMISNKEGTRDVILLDLGELSGSCTFEKAEFEELVNLRVLRLEGGNLIGDFSNYFPNLLWLEWRSFPSNFQAQNFSPPNLIVLKLAETNIDERWTGWKGLLGSKLKFLELSGCGGLTRTPDFSTCLGLEVLVLQNIERLIEIDSSIGNLEQLLHLEIKGSPNLTGLPQSLTLLKRMEKLIVTGNVHEMSPVKFHLPIEFDNLKSLCHLAIEGVGLEALPKGIGQLKLLKYLSLARCSHLTSLSESVWELESLEELDLSWCLKLEQIPSEIGNLFSLRVLNLGFTSIVELPSSVMQLSRLQHLYMGSFKELKKVEQLLTSLSHLYGPYISLQVKPDLSNLVNVVRLELRSYVPSDEEDRWRRFRSLDVASIETLPKLKRLVIGVESELSCSDTQFLSQLPHNLSGLILKKFRAETLYLPDFPNLKNLSELFIDGLSSGEIELRGLEVLGNLQKIDVWDCQSLARLSISSCPKKLNSLGIMGCPKLVEVEGVSRLESLQTLCLSKCPSLSRLSDLSKLVKMKEFQMHHCGSIERMPALPGKENPFNLVVKNCGKLRDFVGPHDLYVGDYDVAEQSDRCICTVCFFFFLFLIINWVLLWRNSNLSHEP